MKGVLRAMMPREEGLDKNIKPNETQTPVTSSQRRSQKLFGEQSTRY
jgi:hypothetical protein